MSVVRVPIGLPEDLKRRASAHMPESNEAVWTRDDALLVLDALDGGRVGVSGVDVVTLQDGRWRHAHATSSVRPRKQESAEEYVARSLVESRTYLESYADPGDGSHGYVLVWHAI